MIYKHHNFELLPYDATLDIKCINSNKTNRKILDNVITSTDYSFTTNALGKGVSYFLESLTEPMTMTFKVEDGNGQLVSISTDLQLSNISTTNDMVTGNNKITQFTISNKNWFDIPYPTETISVEKVLKQVQIQLKQPAYDYNFTVNGTKKEPDEVLSNNTIFIFDVNKINLNSLVKASYKTHSDEEEEIKAMRGAGYSYVKTKKSWIPDTVIAYKPVPEPVEIINKDFSERKIYFNKDEINDNEIRSKIKYPISSPTNEYSYIEKNSSSTYIKLTNKWVDTPIIYQVSSYTTTIQIAAFDYTDNDSVVLFFNDEVAPAGKPIFVSYTTESDYKKEEFLIPEERPDNITAVTTSLKPTRYLTAHATFTSSVLNNIGESLKNNILYLSNELEKDTMAYIEYNYPLLVEENSEIIKEDNNYYSQLSRSWLNNFSEMIEGYKYVWGSVEPYDYNTSYRNIYFKQSDVPIGTSTLIQYKAYDSSTTETNLIPTTTDEGYKCEGIISNNNKNKIIFECLDSNNHIVPWLRIKNTQENDKIQVSKAYDNQNITIVFEKEPPYIQLHCNNVKVECCFTDCGAGDGERSQNGWEGIMLPDEYTMSPFSNIAASICSLSRYITVSWDKPEPNILLLGNDASGYRYQAWASFCNSNGDIVGFKNINKIWDTSNYYMSSSGITVPPLNGTSTYYFKYISSTTIVKNYFKVGYSINLYGEGAYQGESSLSINTDNATYYDKDGYLYVGKLSGFISSSNGSPSIYTHPATTMWGKNSKFYKVLSTNPLETYYISPSSNIKINSEWETSTYSPCNTKAQDDSNPVGKTGTIISDVDLLEWLPNGTRVVSAGQSYLVGKTCYVSNRVQNVNWYLYVDINDCWNLNGHDSEGKLHGYILESAVSI